MLSVSAMNFQHEFHQGFHNYVARLHTISSGASTPLKPWSKCSMENLGGAFLPIFEGEGEIDLK